jgi:hypothetical protein
MMSLVIGLPTFSSGVIDLDGKFYGKTPTDFQILKKNQIFTIDKSKITEEQRRYLESLKWQQKVSVSVATTSIKDVHDKK